MQHLIHSKRKTTSSVFVTGKKKGNSGEVVFHTQKKTQTINQEDDEMFNNQRTNHSVKKRIPKQREGGRKREESKQAEDGL